MAMASQAGLIGCTRSLVEDLNKIKNLTTVLSAAART